MKILKVVSDIYNMLDTEGIFIFHKRIRYPLAIPEETDGQRDRQGNKIHLNLSDYGIEGEESQYMVC